MATPPASPPPPPPGYPWAGWAQPGSTPGGPYWAPPTAPPVASAPRRRHLVTLIAVVALLAGGLGASLDAVLTSSTSALPPQTPVATLPSSNSAPVPSANSSAAKIASSVDKSVVDINTTVASPAGEGTESGAATGMIVTKTGEVLTNNHVVEDATSIEVTIEGHQGHYTANVIGVDPTQDVALIQIVSPPANLPYVSFGNSSKVTVGTEVIAVGNALGLGGKPSVVTGTITAVNKTITAGDQLSPERRPRRCTICSRRMPTSSRATPAGPLLNLAAR